MAHSDENTPQRPSEWRFEKAFDGGDTGCGELLIDLRAFLMDLEPHTPVAVIARDPGAPIEMPAWCRMSRHRLIAACHPHYLIAKREA